MTVMDRPCPGVTLTIQTTQPGPNHLCTTYPRCALGLQILKLCSTFIITLALIDGMTSLQEPLSSVLLTVGSNWVRSRGLPAIEDALIGQMDRHKKKNLKIIKTFAEDIVEKLQPIYAYKVEPWLSQHATLRLLVQDTRAATLRAGCRWVLDQCSIALPLPMARDRPKFSRVRILLDDGTVIKEMQLESEHDGGGPEMIADPQNMRVRGNTRVTLPPGQSFVVQAWIRRFAEYHPLARCVACK
eukprot:SAG31_NODE_1007_length_10425_cov_4.852799_9_plen_243_part_00